MQGLRLTAFQGHKLLATGDSSAILAAMQQAGLPYGDVPVTVFEDATGRVIDLDPRTAGASPSTDPDPQPTRGRGRPRLGVVPREVTLLPRHWDWLSAQPGGASVALRRLVDAARKSASSDSGQKQSEAAYRFMTAIAGNLPGYEEALRALFARDPARFEECIAAWPEAIRAYAWLLAFTGNPS